MAAGEKEELGGLFERKNCWPARAARLNRELHWTQGARREAEQETGELQAYEKMKDERNRYKTMRGYRERLGGWA